MDFLSSGLDFGQNKQRLRALRRDRQATKNALEERESQEDTEMTEEFENEEEVKYFSFINNLIITLRLITLFYVKTGI